MIYIITALFIGFTVPFLSFLNKKANVEKSLLNSNELEMPKIYLIMGYFMILISLGILIIPRLMKNPPAYYHPIIWIIIIAIFLFGLYIIRLYVVHKVEIRNDVFIIKPSFGDKISFKVDEIESLKMNHATYFINIKSKNGQKGKVYFHITGLIHLLRDIQEKSGTDISKIEKLLKI